MTRAIGLLGLPGTAGALLFVVAVLVWSIEVAPLHEREASIRQSLQAERAPRRPMDVKSDRSTGDAQERLKFFYEALSRQQDPSDALAALHAVGRYVAVQSRRAEYRMEALQDSPLKAYTIQLSLSGSYAAVRTYIEHTLYSLPYASLDAAKFERASAGGPIDASLTFTFFLGTL